MWRVLAGVLVAVLSFGLCVSLPARADEPQIKVKPFKLVRIVADGVDPKAALVWRVTPSKDVSKATSPRGVLEFVAPPGVYLVELLVITSGPDGALSVDEKSVTVEIESLVPDKPPPPKQPDAKKPDAQKALGQIQFGNAGCTATVIGPRRADGKWDVLTAAHCITNVGQRGTLKLKDGRALGITAKVLSKRSGDGGPDCCWCVTDDVIEDMPFAVIAEKNPDIGVTIWHAGYGIDKPGNREDGEITGAEDSNGQLQMFLSVSSGDSGGGIFRDDTNELISVVCCTTKKGAKADVWGCSAEVARKLRPKSNAGEKVPMPIRVPDRGCCGFSIQRGE